MAEQMKRAEDALENPLIRKFFQTEAKAQETEDLAALERKIRDAERAELRKETE